MNGPQGGLDDIVRPFLRSTSVNSPLLYSPLPVSVREHGSGSQNADLNTSTPGEAGNGTEAQSSKLSSPTLETIFRYSVASPGAAPGHAGVVSNTAPGSAMVMPSTAQDTPTAPLQIPVGGTVLSLSPPPSQQGEYRQE